jgi:hypothetical protein
MTKNQNTPRVLSAKEITQVSGGESDNGTGFYWVRENEGGTGRWK